MMYLNSLRFLFFTTMVWFATISIANASGVGVAGGPRHLDLYTTSGTQNLGAFGRVLIYPNYGPDHPRFPNQPARFVYDVKKVTSLDSGGIYIPLRHPSCFELVDLTPQNPYCDTGGDAIFVVYLWSPNSLGNITENCSINSCRSRMQSFNSQFSSETHEGERWLHGFPAADTLFTSDLCVEIWLEKDDGIDGPDLPGTDPGTSINYPHLRAETTPGICTLLK